MNTKIEWNILDGTQSEKLKFTQGNLVCEDPEVLIENCNKSAYRLTVTGTITKGTLEQVEDLLGCKVKVL